MAAGRSVLFAVSTLIVACIGAQLPAWAQSYPDRTVRLIVPFSAGGPGDTLARLVAQELSTKFNQAMVVENQPGAGGAIANVAMATAEPNGYTLLMGTSSTLFIAPVLNKGQNFDPKSIVPIALVATVPMILAVRPDVPATTIAELIAYMKANPGKLNFGAPLGTSPHLLGELLKARAGVDATFIPYKGGAPSITDLLGGTTQFAIDAPNVLLPHIAMGKLKAITVFDVARTPLLPDVPTMLESGFAGFDTVPFWGLMGPAGTPSAVIKKLNAATIEWLNTPAAKQSLDKFGGRAQPGSAEDFVKYISDVTPKWKELVKILDSSNP